jgi:hypothetical protein
MASRYVGVGVGYSNPADWRYEGAYVGDKSTGVNVRYASDAYWGSGIAGIMYRLDQKLGGRDRNKYELVKPTTSGSNVRPTASTTQSPLYQVKSSMVLTGLGNELGWLQIIADSGNTIWASNGEPAVYISRTYARDLSVVR